MLANLGRLDGQQVPGFLLHPPPQHWITGMLQTERRPFHSKLCTPFLSPQLKPQSIPKADRVSAVLLGLFLDSVWMPVVNACVRAFSTTPGSAKFLIAVLDNTGKHFISNVPILLQSLSFPLCWCHQIITSSCSIIIMWLPWQQEYGLTVTLLLPLGPFPLAGFNGRESV